MTKQNISMFTITRYEKSTAKELSSYSTSRQVKTSQISVRKRYRNLRGSRQDRTLRTLRGSVGILDMTSSRTRTLCKHREVYGLCFVTMFFFTMCARVLPTASLLPCINRIMYARVMNDPALFFLYLAMTDHSEHK